MESMRCTPITVNAQSHKVVRAAIAIVPVLALCVPVALSTSTSAESLQGVRDQEIRAQVKKLGSIEILIVKEYSPVDLATLVSKADLVVRGIVAQAKSSLVGKQVSTEYTLQVLSVIQGQRDGEGAAITIRREGGQVSVEGGTVLAYDPDFPFFELAKEYVLFLKRLPEGPYVVPYGAQGAFRVEGGKVSQVSRDTGSWNQERGSIGVSQFFDEIAAVARQNQVSKNR
jgi:hypothetical protein